MTSVGYHKRISIGNWQNSNVSFCLYAYQWDFQGVWAFGEAWLTDRSYTDATSSAEEC